MPAPDRASLIAWPEDFGTRFTIFVDTEEEFDWRKPLDRDSRGTTAIRGLPDAHRRLADRGAALTYLIDHPIATDQSAVEILRRLIEDGRSAVGTQLHPWVNPPFEEEVNGFNSFAGNLPQSLEAAKIAALTDAIEAGFGARPIAYRAGRYGLGPNTLGLLAAQGYRLDTSMRAAYDYSTECGPDYGAVPNHAFRAGPGGAVVELPFSTVFTGLARAGGAALHAGLSRVPRGIGAASRLRLLSRVALTPEDMPVHEALEAVRIAVGQGQRVLNFAFHSPSVVPGHTPYVRDAAGLAAFNHWWDAVLDLLGSLGVRSASLDELLAAADSACGGGPTSASPLPAGGL